MKIGVDFRFFQKDDYYSLFALETIKTFSSNDKYRFIIYLNEESQKDFFKFPCNFRIVKEKTNSFFSDLSLSSKFDKEKFDLMIFFNEYKPINYKKNYIIIISDLQKLLYGVFKTSMAKHHYIKLIEKNLKNAKKIICFNKQVRDDINEKFNIIDTNIEVIDGFFTIDFSDNVDKKEEFVDIKQKHNLSGDYLIYDLSSSEVKNLEKIFLAIKNLKDQGTIINLFIFGEKNCDDIGFRKIVLDYNISDCVFFISDITKADLYNYYKQSLGTIYPNIYDSFPFGLANALAFKNPILTSDSVSMKELFGDLISYFNILSNIDTQKALLNFFTKKVDEIDYTSVIEKNSVKNYVNNLEDIITNALLN